MTIVADTSVLIDHLRGHEPATSLIADAVAAGERIAVATITRVELRAGERPAEGPAVEALLATLDSIALTSGIADVAGTLARAHAGSHPGIETADCVIAATAISTEATLWTRNVRHFPMFANLEPPY